jgi:uncharacterized protein (DUF2384 family)
MSGTGDLERLLTAALASDLHRLAITQIVEIVRLAQIERELVAAAPQRLERVHARAEEVFGDASEAWTWMRVRNRLLQAVPLELIRTEEGAAQVEHLLAQIDYGVFL